MITVPIKTKLMMIGIINNNVRNSVPERVVALFPFRRSIYPELDSLTGGARGDGLLVDRIDLRRKRVASHCWADGGRVEVPQRASS